MKICLPKEHFRSLEFLSMEAFSSQLITPPVEPVEGDMEDDGLFRDLVKQIALLMIEDDEKLQMAHGDSSEKHDSYLNFQNERRPNEFGPSLHCDFRSSSEVSKWQIVHAADQAVRLPFSEACICRAGYRPIRDNALLRPCNPFPNGSAFSNFSYGQGKPPAVFPVREVSGPWNFRGKLVKREGSGTGVFIPRSCKLSYIEDTQQAAGLQYAHSATSLLRRGENLRYRQRIHPQSLRMLTSARGLKGNDNGLRLD